MKKAIARPGDFRHVLWRYIARGKLSSAPFSPREGMLEKGLVLAFARAIYSQRLDGTQRGDV